MKQEEYYARMFMKECLSITDTTFNFNDKIGRTMQNETDAHSEVINRYYGQGAYDRYLDLKKKYS